MTIVLSRIPAQVSYGDRRAKSDNIIGRQRSEMDQLPREYSLEADR